MLENLNKLSKKEVNKFGIFIRSDYYNTNKNVIKLFKYLSTLHPKISEENIKKKILFRKIYRKGKYSDGVIRKTIFIYLKVFDKFLIQLETENNTVKSNISLMNSYKKHGLLKNFKDQIKSLYQLIERHVSVKSYDYYDYKCKVLYEECYYKHYFENVVYRKGHQMSHDFNDYMFIILKLFCFQIFYTLESNENNQIKFERTFYDVIISTIEKNKRHYKTKHHYIYMRYLALMMFTHDDFKYFSEFLNYYKSYKKYFKKEMLAEYQKNVENYLRRVTKYKEHNIIDAKKLFGIYDSMLMKRNPTDSESLLQNGMLADILFFKSVMAGINVKRYEWIEKFIERYKDSVKGKSSKDVINLSYANYYFCMGEYSLTMNYINKVSYQFSELYLHSKTLLLKTFYEMSDFSPISFEINNVLKYIRLNKEYPKNFRKYFTTFIRYIRKLVKLKESKIPLTGSNLRVLRKELDNEKEYVLDKNWFYEKLGEITVSSKQLSS